MSKKIRDYLSQEFQKKVYPDPQQPEVAEKLAAWRSIFERGYLGLRYSAVLNGKEISSAVSYETCDPNDPSIVTGRFPKFVASELKELISFHLPKIRQAGRKFFLDTTWQDRVKLLKTISEVVKKRFWLLCAAKMYETGQSVMEAIGETDEEADFPLANAMYLEDLHNDPLIGSPEWSGNINGKRFVPHGVFLNVSPFNFPGAIPMDMATKALAMGNAIIEKSSPKTSLNGYLVWESIMLAFEHVGIDWRGVVNYFPGDAAVVNAFLSHPGIVGMSFTGSSAVLYEIKKEHGDLPRLGWAGRAKLVTGSAETSGVNIFIVCGDANVEKAAREYVRSFTGRSGQKCSSARIGFVHKSLYDSFVWHAVRYLDELRYGDVKSGADLGAMITTGDADKLRMQIRRLKNKRWVELIYKKAVNARFGNDFPPTLLSARIGRLCKNTTIMNTEFFGPVSTVIKFENILEVEQMCGLCDFALTGAIFTNSNEMLQWVLSFIPAGNVYWNRKCTGALVETECFGGLRSASSPNGIKGRGSLLLFGSQNTFSGFYGENPSEPEKDCVRRMLEKSGYILSKS